MIGLPPSEVRFVFHCPGCECGHYVRTMGPEPRWEFNGDQEKPTVSPSILVFWDDPARRCHSFVKDGMIQFLDDCWHPLKGQTVALPEWDGEKFA